jgi:hypothetical protein
MANEAAIAANMPVKNIVAPIPAYLLVSVGVLLRIEGCIPEQKRKKFFKESIFVFFLFDEKVKFSIVTVSF